MCLKSETYRIVKGWRDGTGEVLGLRAGIGLSGTVAHWLLTYQATAPPLAFWFALRPLKLCCLHNSSKHSQGTSVVSVCAHLVSSYWKCLKETPNATEQANNSVSPDPTCSCSLWRIFVSRFLVRHSISVLKKNTMVTVTSDWMCHWGFDQLQTPKPRSRGVLCVPELKDFASLFVKTVILFNPKLWHSYSPIIVFFFFLFKFFSQKMHLSWVGTGDDLGEVVYGQGASVIGARGLYLSGERIHATVEL